MIKFSNPEKENKEIEPILLNNAINASVVYYMEVSEHFGTENYVWRLDIVLNVSCLMLWYIFFSKYI